MGVVWQALNLRTHRTIALKILKAETTEQRRRLFREGRIAGRLRHPNIVEVQDVVELEDGVPAIVMERLSGESLRDLLLRERALSPARITTVFVSVAEALACAHAHGVVHRDLKPENVFVARTESGNEQIKVLDFGIARLTASDGEIPKTVGLTDTGDVLGTPSYMAPEQVFGEKDVDTRADVWSFGVMLYECLTGHKPFVGDNFGQIFKQVAMGDIRPIEELAPDVSHELRELVSKLLVRDRAERLTDWGHVVAVLKRDGTSPSREGAKPRVRRGKAAYIAIASGMLGAVFMAHRLLSGPPPPLAMRSGDVDAAVAVNDALPKAAVESPQLPPPHESAPRSNTTSPAPARSTTGIFRKPVPKSSAVARESGLPGGVHGTSPY